MPDRWHEAASLTSYARKLGTPAQFGGSIADGRPVRGQTPEKIPLSI